MPAGCLFRKSPELSEGLCTSINYLSRVESCLYTLWSAEWHGFRMIENGVGGGTLNGGSTSSGELSHRSKWKLLPPSPHRIDRRGEWAAGR